MDLDIGQFDSEFLLDFISKEVGPYYYNCALNDARVFIHQHVDNISDSLYDIEQPTNFSK